MLPMVNARMRNRLSRNIGCATRVSTQANTTSTAIPPKTAASTFGLVQPVGWPPYGSREYTMPLSSEIRPTANSVLPSQSILAGTRIPLSFSFRYAHTVPNRPNGTETRNTSRHSIGASTPPRISPRNDPPTAAMPLIPIALPRSSSGNASVRIAVELANRNAPPTPWKTRMMMIHKTPGTPVRNVTDSRIEKTVKTAKPRLYIFTRP